MDSLRSFTTRTCRDFNRSVERIIGILQPHIGLAPLEQRDEDPLYDTNLELLKQRLDMVMNELSYREREIIRLRFGLADGYSYTLEEVGKIFSVTRERVRQIQVEALKRLRVIMETHGLSSEALFN